MTRLYVGNLSFHTTEAALQEAFVACGDVSEVKIVLDRETGRSRGFAFVTMSNNEGARAAMGARQVDRGDAFPPLVRGFEPRPADRSRWRQSEHRLHLAEPEPDF